MTCSCMDHTPKGFGCQAIMIRWIALNSVGSQGKCPSLNHLRAISGLCKTCSWPIFGPVQDLFLMPTASWMCAHSILSKSTLPYSPVIIFPPEVTTIGQIPWSVTVISHMLRWSSRKWKRSGCIRIIFGNSLQSFSANSHWRLEEQPHLTCRQHIEWIFHFLHCLVAHFSCSHWSGR